VDHRVRVHLHTLSYRPPKLGNPLESEQAAFRWVVAVVIATSFVILVALLISKPVALIVGLILVGIVTVSAIKGIIGMLRPPDDEDEGGSGPDRPS
jgi:hypothetical protein